MLSFLAKRRFNLAHLAVSIIVFQYIVVGMYIEAAISYIAGVVVCSVIDRTASKGPAVAADSAEGRFKP